MTNAAAIHRMIFSFDGKAFISTKTFKAPASTKSVIKLLNGWYNTSIDTRHYVNGRISREDGPARITNDGTQYWYTNGSQTREDGPQETRPDGTEIWRTNGKLHREGGLPAVEGPKEIKYVIHGKYHREGGLPAVIRSNGYKAWKVNDQFHRTEGPAIILPNGEVMWRVYGKEVDIVAVLGYEPKDLLSEEEQTVLLLKVS